MKRRILAIGLAVVLALLGTVGVLMYVRQANARAVAGVKAVNVLVAQGQIPSGTSAASAQSAGLLRSEKLPADSVPANAVNSITPSLGSLVTSADVQPGQVLLRPMLVAASQASGGLAVPSGMVAVTITLCVPAAVAGNVHPGSEVMIFNTTESGSSSGGSGSGLSESAACSGQHSQNISGSPYTQVALPKVEVLSVGTPVTGSTSQANTASSGQGSATAISPTGVMLLTLAVTPSDAKALILLTETGLPYLALLN